MFEHPNFDHYAIEKIPLDCDIYLRDEKYMAKYHQAAVEWAEGREEEWKNVGYVTFVAARRVDDCHVELSWMADFFKRYHAVTILLPRDQILCCVGAWRWDEKPTIWVKSGWLDQLYSRMYAVFGMVDVIGMRDALAKGMNLSERLPALRAAIDEVARKYPSLAFVSFADSLLIKSDWNATEASSEGKYRYNPEQILDVFRELRSAYKKQLGLDIYGIFTQGANEYINDTSLHISDSGNHVCLNSLGGPFADLMAIDKEARRLSKQKDHGPHELYLDQEYFMSLRLGYKYEPRQTLRRYDYDRVMTKQVGQYVCTSCDELLSNLDPVK